MITQLPLAFNLLDNVTFSNFFFSEQNKQLYFSLKNFLEPNNLQENFFYLWGNQEAGKTHLLQACCNYALEKNISAMYISLENYKHNNFLDGLDNLNLLCLDNLNLLINNFKLEEQLFYFFNKMRAKRNKLIISSNCPPNKLNLELLDLKSRMSWGMNYCIYGLIEQEKVQALVMRAEQIGLKLDEIVANFLLTRISRNTGKLFKVLEELDMASLAAKRRLTIPFVKAVLNI
jgi:DnaA-homolog protein